MDSASDTTLTPAQVRERMCEYRESGFQERAMPHIVFQPGHHSCPWAGCSFSIAGIDFQLELLGDEQAYQRWMQSWWKGPGLVGRCPGCGNHVLYTMHEKRAVDDPTTFKDAILPDDWHTHAYLLA